jgi:hypothetical protein
MKSEGTEDFTDPNKPPRNYRDAMQREEWQEWAEAYDKECSRQTLSKHF